LDTLALLVPLAKKPLQGAQECGWIDRSMVSLSDAIPEADIIILATPVRPVIQIIKEVAPWVKPGAFIMDVGSTKAEIVAAMNMLPTHIQAIGGHPMTGALTTGFTRPNGAMFRDRTFVLTPTQRASEETQAYAEQLVRRIGSCPVVLGAEHHDYLGALISHLPRLLPLALIDTVYAAKDELAWDLAAGGFRESTSKATDNIATWLDVLVTNSQGIIAAIHALQECLYHLAHDIAKKDEATAQALLEGAAREWHVRFG
jgi:prephenate dehydrogenase